MKDRLLNRSVIDWDNETPTPEYFQELFRISKNQIIWGGNYFDLSPTRCIICWDKLQPWDNFSQWEMAWTSFDKPAKMFRYSNTGGANSEKKIHPTQKPVKLYQFLLNEFAKEGDKIFDSHLGSMSIVLACLSYDHLKLHITGCENNTLHYQDGIKRVKQYESQFKMSF